MKYVFSVIIACWCILSSSAGNQLFKNEILVFSDLHVVEPMQAMDLKLQPGERKLINRSAEIFEDYIYPVHNTDEHLPKLVLITGDLTEYGDLASHQYVASQLCSLIEAGVKVLVIPGNHDLGKEVNKDDFARIYADFGYTGTTRHDKSLSYICEPIKGLVILAIDSNGDSNEAIKWAANEAKKYKGKNVIAIMHHHLFPHFLEEDKVMATSVIDNSQAMCDLLIKSGVHTVLSGHTHIHDAAVAYNTNRTDSIIEVCTGALSAYPHYYRELYLKGNKIKQDASAYKFSVYDAKNDYDPIPYSCESKELVEKAMPVIIKSMVRRYWDKAMQLVEAQPMAKSLLADGLNWEMASELIDKNLTPYLTQVYLLASMGNENKEDTRALKENIRNGIKATVKGVLRPEFSQAIDMVAPLIDTRIMPIVNSILDDTNKYSSTPLSDSSPFYK